VDLAAFDLVLFFTQIPPVLGGVLAAKKWFGRAPDELWWSIEVRGQVRAFDHTQQAIGA
jgi:hypothetical protein